MSFIKNLIGGGKHSSPEREITLTETETAVQEASLDDNAAESTLSVVREQIILNQSFVDKFSADFTL